MIEVTLGEIAAALGGELLGSGDTRIRRIAPLEAADASSISFLSNPRYRQQLADSRAACVIVAPSLREDALRRGTALIAPDPYLYFARLTQWWAARTRVQPTAGIHPTAVVDAGAQVAASASVGPYVVIEAGAMVGEGCVIGAHGFIGRNARVGAHSRLAPRVNVGFDCVVGEQCVLHGGVVIGADGFGFAPTRDGYVKIEQLGAVRIGNDVEIGANTCIDRGALGDTVLEDGVKLDNLIQIAHNVHIGAHTAMAGCSAVAGSTHIGSRCTIGGGAGILGHLTIADDVHISAQSTVSRSIRVPGQYTGFFPLDDNRSWEKNAVTLRQLHLLRERIRSLERALGTATGNEGATSDDSGAKS